MLAEEIELRRHIERVAEQGHALAPGGTVPQNCELIGENGPVTLSEWLGDKQTLEVYSCVYGQQRKRF